MDTCYRHTDRETGISCTRCDRPICPDCMISASVGYQCPECVRGAPAAVPRNVAGAVLTAGDPHLVTKILIGINVAVFLAVLATPALAVHLELLGRYVEYIGGPVQGVSTGEYHRLLTSVFLHQEWWHLAGNMLGLWVVGGPLEAAIGRARYLSVYLLSGLAGSALVYLLTPPNLATLGASGAVFGLFGATAVLMRRMRYDMAPVAGMLVLMLAMTFIPSGVSWQAHIGGLVAGALVGAAMVWPTTGGRNRTAVQWAVCALVFCTSAAMILLRTAELTS
ncbi:rhomboid family intramembrane serine protease [Streptomyces venezuelae]|uniref:Rhomboid family intramembrane serine protease n=1 Tax=Streptomyces venezuelae TaxID=54571 RepID=A0A5P2D208_STRVZ|nr:rhomboid family intramembrane serine protease [Streptomyces venezuelae]QES49184.1 rhomboid family intramembrane serine protease [Streptomyces venezuelae]